MPVTENTPSLSEIRSQSHFLIYGPAGFVCRFTMDAVQLINDKQLRLIFCKTDDLEHLKLPAFPNVVFEPAKMIAAGKYVIIPDNMTDKQAAEKMTASWPQIFLFTPSDNKYHYIGGMSDISGKGTQETWLAKYDSA